MQTARQKITGRSAWIGSDLLAKGDWIYPLTESHIAEIDAALARVRNAPLYGYGKQDFPLQGTADLLARVSDEVENGYGCARISGLPVERYSETDLRHIFWGIGTHMGTAVFQNRRGEIMTEVVDKTRDPRYTPAAGPGTVVSSRAKALSNVELRFHTDGSDVISLLCVRAAARGGETKLASIAKIHNQMLEQRPELLEHLFHDYVRVWPSSTDNPNEHPTFALPVFGMRDGKITSQYTRTAVEQAQELPGVPRLSAEQDEALSLHAAIAEATCLRTDFQPGDIQFVNNHSVYHSRSAFEDEETGAGRMLLRLWFSMPNSRALPEGFERYWGGIEAGALRGGVPQRDGSRALGTPKPLAA